MTRPVAVIGLGADGLAGITEPARRAILDASFLAGGGRHLALIPPSGAVRFVITSNLPELADRLRRRAADERCVVLATGDPLFFGIGHFLGEALGRDQIAVVPTVSGMQVAFARAGLSWHDAEVASIHGRPAPRVLLPLLGRPKIGLFTADGDGPSTVASFFLARGLDDYHAWVGEDLGGPDERVTSCPLAELAGRRFRVLNVVILLRRGGMDPARDRRGIVPDEQFAVPGSGPVLLSHADVRALVLARFHDLPADGPIWDVGAGLGGVAIDLARAFPAREVVAVERSSERAEWLRMNRARFGAYNVRVLVGEAPECLAGEDDPSAVFLGGSGGRIDAILDTGFHRLTPGGVLVANFVGLENLAQCLGRIRGAGWAEEVCQVHVSHGRPLAGMTTFEPRRPVWIVQARRPAAPGDGHGA